MRGDEVFVYHEDGKDAGLFFKTYCRHCDNLLGYSRTVCCEGPVATDEMVCYTCVMAGKVKVEQK